MTIGWFLGSGGLLGAALCRVLRTNGTELFFPAERFCWDNEAQIVHQITEKIRYTAFFPNLFRVLRRLEILLNWLPLDGQYYVLSNK